LYNWLFISTYNDVRMTLHAYVIRVQFFSDTDDVDTSMLDMLRLVSSEDVGHDEASVQSPVVF